MRHRVATFKIGRTGAHRRAMLANMVSSLFANGKIETTLVKAKAARSFAEKMITLGKKGDIHNRRQAFSKLRNKDAVKLLFDEIAPGYATRNGGYTRILKLGKRRGDAAEMCILALVEASVEAPKAEEAQAE
jgi:large subunit ribosomal protein L17